MLWLCSQNVIIIIYTNISYQAAAWQTFGDRARSMMERNEIMVSCVKDMAERSEICVAIDAENGCKEEILWR